MIVILILLKCGLAFNFKSSFQQFSFKSLGLHSYHNFKNCAIFEILLTRQNSWIYQLFYLYVIKGMKLQSKNVRRLCRDREQSGMWSSLLAWRAALQILKSRHSLWSSTPTKGMMQRCRVVTHKGSRFFSEQIKVLGLF